MSVQFNFGLKSYDSRSLQVPLSSETPKTGQNGQSMHEKLSKKSPSC